MKPSAASPLHPKQGLQENACNDTARRFPLFTWTTAVSIATLLAGFLAALSFLPLRTAVLIGADEGFETAKAVLWLKGYHLYTDVWNDQPPLHTFVLTEVIRHFSFTMLGPRLLTAAFALLMLTALFFLAWRLTGTRVAVLTTLFLIASPGFILLGCSCMLEIPGLAPVLASLCLLAFAERMPWHLAETLAGILFGLALELKLIGLVTAPLAAALIWLAYRNRPSQSWIVAKSLFFFAISMAATMVATDTLTCHGAYLAHFQQSWASHFGATKSLAHGSPNDHPFDWAALLRNWDLTLPAAVAAVLCLRHISDAKAAALPLAWLVYNLAVFGSHRPWWNYYYVHTAVPLCWCAAIGIDALWKKARDRRATPWRASLVLYAFIAAPWMAERIYLEVQSVRHSPQTYACLFLHQMERYKPQTQWLYADEPIYSFHSGIPLVPDLGVVVAKRFWSGELTDAQLNGDLASYKPELILLKNDSNPRSFQDLLNADYRLIYMDAGHLLFLRKSLSRPGVQ
jgi:4-amino-4-deoxy-L-arabinose transferase-like glycosyltransferase